MAGGHSQVSASGQARRCLRETRLQGLRAGAERLAGGVLVAVDAAGQAGLLQVLGAPQTEASDHLALNCSQLLQQY